MYKIYIDPALSILIVNRAIAVKLGVKILKKCWLNQEELIC